MLELSRHLEAVPPVADPPEAKILRGLFYVHLYAALEYAVNQGVQRFLQAIDALCIPPSHLEARFFSVVLDANFNSIRNVGEEKRWSARSKLIDLQSSTQSQSINGDIFGLYLQNVWIERLDALFNCLNIHLPVVPDPSFRLYIDELVERRNAVAHGRISALGIGAARRSPELVIRFNAVSSTCIYILDCFEEHYLSCGVIMPGHRPIYATRI